MSKRTQRRLNAGLGLVELARKVGCDVWTVRHWEAGTTKESRYEAAIESVLEEAEASPVLKGIKLRAERESHGITQQQLADAAGLSSRSVWEAEHRERGTGETLRKLTRALAELVAAPERMPPRRRVATERKQRNIAVHTRPPRMTKTARLGLIRERHRVWKKRHTLQTRRRAVAG